MERCELDYSHPYGCYWIRYSRHIDEVLPVTNTDNNRVKTRTDFCFFYGRFYMLNTSLLKHPLNWITVLLMLTLAGMGGHLILSYAGIEPAQSDGK